MVDLKNFIDDLGIAAFEGDLKLAGLAVVSDSGEIMFQTDNWDLKNKASIIIDVINGEKSFEISGGKFSVIETTNDGIITSSDSGMGFIIFAPFQGGVLLSYAMPGADASLVLKFLRNNAMRLNGQI
jgi:hypothetical protein